MAAYAVALPVLVAIGGLDYVQLQTGIGLPARHGERMLVIAHRGDLDRYTENTLEGIVSAANLGIDGIEFDAHASADGTWWVIHDATLDSTTTGTGAISDLGDDDIAAAEIDGGMGFRAGEHEGLRIPRLTEVLEALDNYDGLIVIDLQHVRSGSVHEVAKLLEGHAAYILCRDDAMARIVKVVDPAIRTFVRYGSPTTAAVDGWLAEAIHQATVGTVTRSPLPVIAFLDEWRFGHDETGAIRRAWAAGVEAFLSKEPRAALSIVGALEVDQSR